MEYQDVFVSMAVVLIGIIAMLGLTNYYNGQYGTNAGSTFNNTMTHVNILGNLSTMSIQASNNTITGSGSGTSTGITVLITKSLSTLSALPTFLGIIPAMMDDAAIILNVPAVYITIAGYVFIFIFALLFAYLLLLGAKRL